MTHDILDYHYYYLLVYNVSLWVGLRSKNMYFLLEGHKIESRSSEAMRKGSISPQTRGSHILMSPLARNDLELDIIVVHGIVIMMCCHHP